MSAFALGLDWGTSSLRAWAFDKNGDVLASHADDRGMSKIERSDYPSILAQIKQTLDLEADLPVIICGMAGAAQGWLEVPYWDVGDPLRSVDAFQVPDQPQETRIIQGLCQHTPHSDVMRGEETLLLGANLEKHEDALVCMPGTHSKWAILTNGRLVEFHTHMTGELFAQLSQSSTLSHFIELAPDLHEQPEFKLAVSEASEKPGTILNALFTCRSAPLLNNLDKGMAVAARLSGLLIGLELSGQKQSDVTLLASGQMAKTYESALKHLAFDVDLIDAELAAQRGLFAMAKQLWG